MPNLIPFPVKMGEILSATATRSSIILGAARQVPINWEGNRAFLVNADIPSFQTALGQTKKTNEGIVDKIDLVTLTIPCDFRMTRQEIEAAKENGTYNELVATRLAENMSQMYRAIDYAIVHGYDLATGTKITTYDNVNGCLENAQLL
ncbi:hypothetical protein [Mycoplasma sp. P36-A1]|uniref:hypothetical protein n=1 Tax=Mycoplasma sp. P36-A1 TaxID=3252900 RepID=UPI003C2BE3CA